MVPHPKLYFQIIRIGFWAGPWPSRHMYPMLNIMQTYAMHINVWKARCSPTSLSCHSRCVLLVPACRSKGFSLICYRVLNQFSLYLQINKHEYRYRCIFYASGSHHIMLILRSDSLSFSVCCVFRWISMCLIVCSIGTQLSFHYQNVAGNLSKPLQECETWTLGISNCSVKTPTYYCLRKFVINCSLPYSDQHSRIVEKYSNTLGVKWAQIWGEPLS